MKKYFTLLALALVTLVSCDKDNPIPEPSQGEQVNISVEMSADDSGIKLSWHEGDQLTVSRGGENQIFTLKGGEGTTTGTFSGTVPGGMGNYTLTYGSGDMKGQAQSADASTAHLKKYIRMEAVAASLLAKIDLKMTGCIMTFALSGLPADVGTLHQLTWATEGDAQTNLLPLDLTGCTLSNGTLTAYLAFVPTEMNIKKGGKLTVMLSGSQKVCRAVMTLADGMSYTAGKLYTTTVDGTNTQWQVMTPPMRFMVKVDETLGLGFNIPFAESGTTPAEITVDWGDGSAPAVVTSGTALSGDDSFNHTYATAGTYQISITSIQVDDTKQQMPEFNFYNYRAVNKNALKLISMDTPMLNIGVPDLSFCFSKCSSLTSISAGLFDQNTQVTDFGNCFDDCTSLESIPAGLFDKNTQATDFSYCFSECASLNSIPAGLFDQNTQATNFDGCFGSWTSLNSIPTGLFDQNTQAMNFDGCFYDCTSLNSIPTGLFDKNMRVTNFNSCFESCTSLNSIPTGLFDKNTQVENFMFCFADCSALKSIPTGLFDKNTQVTDFKGCFMDCLSLTSIPAGLFDHNTQVTNFWKCFVNCPSLTSIPAGLFDHNTQVTNFESCFKDCTKLTSIPTGLFDHNTQVTNFMSCFAACTSLNSIPTGLFDKNTQVENFMFCFGDCSALKSIPAGLFDKNTQVTDFMSCFGGCSSLKSIPTGLFDKNMLVTSFVECFKNCPSLTSIPTGLFDHNTQVASFNSCFIYCPSLKSIPAGLFDQNTQATSFFGCFANCTSLESIPDGLFDKNTQATSFKGCFADCTSLAVTPKIFSLTEDRVTRFSGKEMDFEDCFLNVGSALTDASSSIAPDLWNYTTGGATWITKDGYKGCKANNTAAADVPVAWGGSK